MQIILPLAALIALSVRRYYHDRASEEKSGLSILVYSSKYFLPQQIEQDDSADTRRLKKTGNVALFVFYFLFMDIVIYGVLSQHV